MARPAPGLPPTAPWVALASIGVVAGISVVAWPWLERRRGGAQAEEARVALAACLGATDDDLLRSRAIAADREGGDWPRRCLEPSAALEVALRRVGATYDACEGTCCVGDDTCVAVETERAQLRRLRGQLTTGRFEGGVADAMGLTPPTPAAAVHPPPRRDQLTPVAEAGFDVTALVDAAEGPSVLLHARGRHASRCTLKRRAGRLDCEPFPPSIPVAGELLLVDGAPDRPLRLMVEEETGWSLRQPDGGVVTRWSGQPVSATHDAVLVERPEEGFVIVGADAQRELAPGSTPLLFGEVVYRTREDDGALRLERRERWDERSRRSAPLPHLDGQVRLQPCRSDAPRLLASGRDGAGVARSVAVFDDGELHATPLPTTPTWYGLTCHRDALSLTWVEEDVVAQRGEAVEGRYRVGRIRCIPGACAPEEVSVELERHHRGSRYVVADLGDAVALVWRSHLGDVRVRIAPLRDLDDAPSEPLFDDAAHGGLAWDGRPAALIPGDGYAVLLAQDEQQRSYGWLLETTGARPLKPR